MRLDVFWIDSTVEPMRAIAERRISEWIENGGLNDILGSGRPQQLDDEPFVPEDLRLSFKILKNAGVVPDWAELGNAIDVERDAIDDWINRSVHALNEANAPTGGGVGNLAEITRRARVRRVEALVTAYKQRLEKLNSLIDRLNVAAPVTIIQRQAVPIGRAVADLRAALSDDAS